MMFDSINDAVIEAAAEYAGNMLALSGFTEVVVEPNDGTRYRFVVLAPSAWACNGFSWERSDGAAAPDGMGEPHVVGYPVERKEYLVSLATTFGKTYPWSGQPMDGSYCQGNWSNEGVRGDGNRWTGEVVARFLTALSRHVGTVD